MTPVLRFRSKILVNFRDYEFESTGTHGFRWVNVKEFELLDASAGPQAVLESLIGDVAFRDDYSGGGIDADGERHGPYWLRRVQPSSFEHVSAGRAVDVLDGWANKYGRIPASLRDEIDRTVLGPIKRSDVCYLLTELDDSAIHDYGRIQIDFYEFVAVHYLSKEVHLIVAADD
ncbi:hypothetical protein GV791_18015 [Nocardia cyriacigeorgica]|uniref:Uncharacterized protein n=1 Tax=Nocardia cyriacigeorgica TaxID=135487 RepID=A0A6P1CPD5_9NOCA|nr:hypothetical protein [Nocardia cyriacigeorgica]NEW34439.1 hypothetical protein [Nocardia cyriacigeorgica]